MKAYTWSGGEIRQGIALTQDERLGQVVFLGEAGRGRRYEKVALGKRNPAEVVNGRVLEAHPVKITLPAKDGKPEKAFYVLEKPRNGNAVLVRVYTLTSYIRGASGRYSTVEGQPETLISGYGAFGDAGRVGTWSDGLVVMKPGDVLRVSPSRGQHSYALWLENGKPATATWQDYENLQAVTKAEALIAEAEFAPQTLAFAFGQMPAFTYAGRGEIRSGLEVSKGTTGPVVYLGEEGRGRRRTEVPLIGEIPMVPCPYRGEESGVSRSIPTVGSWDDPILKCGACGVVMPRTGSPHYDEAHRRPVHPDEGQVPGSLLETAVTILSEKQVPARYYGDKPTVERIYGLAQSSQTETGALLVRVLPTGGGRSYRRTKPLRGESTLIAYGVEASGAAGRAGSWDDTLWVLKTGDAVVIEGTENLRVIENSAGKLITTAWQEWEIADGKANPQAYVERGKAPWGFVPNEWLGRVVQVVGAVREYDSRSREYYTEYREIHEGELISVNPLVVNLGWDGRDRQDVTVESGVWVKLDPHKTARQPEGSELSEREEVKAEAARLKAEASALREQAHFSCFESGLRERIVKVADGRESSSWSDNSIDFSLATTEEIRRWNEWAKGVMSEANETNASAKELNAQRERGEVLVEFGGHFRRMGNSGNGDYWAIRSDGSRREPDEVDYRKRYTSEGSKLWKLVGVDELALSWSCGTMHDITGSSTFTVAKQPVGGVTEAQCQAVAEIEDEIGAARGAFGLDPEAAAELERQINAVREACQRSKVLSSLPELDILAVTGNWGQEVPTEHVVGDTGDYVNHAAGFGEKCANREAQLIDIQPTGDGMLEFLAYHKYGYWNLNIRWRPRRDDELVSEEPTPSPTESDETADLSKVDLSKLFNGGANVRRR